jgi:hypothetical protein
LLNSELLTLQASQYRLLADQLKTDFADIDDDTLKDTLEVSASCRRCWRR